MKFIISCKPCLLYTSNNLVMAFGAYDKSVSWGDAGKVWLVSYLGNFVGCALFGLFFVWAGASGTGDYFAGFINNKPVSYTHLDVYKRQGVSHLP